MPHVASTSKRSVTASTTSSGPRVSTCDACGTIAARSAMRIALETSASPRTSANARSARIAALLCRATKRCAMRGIDVIELGAERGERGVAELRHEPAAEAPARDEAWMPVGDARAPVREGGVELDALVAVARDVTDARRLITTFEEAGERHRRELALRERLREAAPHRGALRRVLAEQERVKEPEAIGIGELPERLSGVLVLGVLAA